MRNILVISAVALTVLAGSAFAAATTTITSGAINGGTGTTAGCSLRNAGTTAVTITGFTISDVNGKGLPLYTGVPNCSGQLAAGGSCFNYTFTAGKSGPFSCQASAASVVNLRGDFVINDSNNNPVAESTLR